VEEALCFGWIDSTVKKVDVHRFAQRFSPRPARIAVVGAEQGPRAASSSRPA
jgi:hypothetical protein